MAHWKKKYVFYAHSFLSLGIMVSYLVIVHRKVRRERRENIDIKRFFGNSSAPIAFSVISTKGRNLLAWKCARLPTPETAFSLCAGTRLPAPRSPSNRNAGTHGNGGQVSGNLPAIATHADIEAYPLYLAMAGGWRAGLGEFFR